MGIIAVITIVAHNINMTFWNTLHMKECTKQWFLILAPWKQPRQQAEDQAVCVSSEAHDNTNVSMEHSVVNNMESTRRITFSPHSLSISLFCKRQSILNKAPGGSLLWQCLLRNVVLEHALPVCIMEKLYKLAEKEHAEKITRAHSCTHSVCWLHSNKIFHSGNSIDINQPMINLHLNLQRKYVKHKYAKFAMNKWWIHDTNKSTKKMHK